MNHIHNWQDDEDASTPLDTNLEDDLQQLWIEVADKVGDKVAPKRPNGSPERGQFLLTQGLMFAELLPKLTKFIEDYHETHAHKSVDGLCCSCPKDEVKIKTMVANELRTVRIKYDDMEGKQNKSEAKGDYDGHVGWRSWKMIRNVITDRIEELTGKRQ